jgi:hypothetical protein
MTVRPLCADRACRLSAGAEAGRNELHQIHDISHTIFLLCRHIEHMHARFT